MTTYNKLLFEISHEGRCGYTLPKAEIENFAISDAYKRKQKIRFVEASELDVVRHFTNLSLKNYGVDQGFYPLGSCTMKYNPKINEEIAKNSGFIKLHPLQSADTIQGALEVYYKMDKLLSAITGMEAFSFNPFAGAHGELVGLMIIKAYHESHNDFERNKIIVPTSAHGTNPASSTCCGYEIIEVDCIADGTVDIIALEQLMDSKVAGVMLTNPNTVGMFEANILEISKIVHQHGGLMYYDGANLNAILGISHPRKMGFDVMHINLHKTFSTPHGGGGPGSGPVGVADYLVDYLPNPVVIEEDGKYYLSSKDSSLGRISGFFGNFTVVLKAYCYILSLGKQNIAECAKYAVLNANYIKESLKDYYVLPIKNHCKHEVVFDGLKASQATTLDVAKRLLDYGYHPPTIYFPLLFHQAMMIEPTECESKEILDSFIETMKIIANEAITNPELLTTAPHNTQVRRLDEVKAARYPVVKYNLVGTDNE